MKKRILTVLTVICTILLTLSLSPVKADDPGYIIKFFDVDITVQEDNVFVIKETIVADFLEDRHGIIRNIPLTNDIVRNDGTTSRNSVHITDVNVEGFDYSISHNSYSDSMSIKIGSAAVYLQGRQTFVINYTYDLGKDPLKGMDEFYFNLIGCEWDTPIEEVHFRIKFPKPIPADKIGFAHGPYGSQSWEGVYYNLTEDNTLLEGSYFETLQPFEGLSSRIELPDKYFYRSFFRNIAQYVWFLFPVAGVLVYFLIFMFVGKDDMVVETVEFYPPKGMDPLDVAFGYYGEVKREHVASLFVYLANHGYLNLVKDKDDYDIYCLKIPEYPKDPLGRIPGYFYNSLYELSDETQDRVVPRSELRSKFYPTVSYVLSNYNTRKKRKNLIKEHKFLAAIGIFFAVYMLFMPFVLLMYGSLNQVSLYITMFFALYFGTMLYSAIVTARQGIKSITIMIVLMMLFHLAAVYVVARDDDLLFSLMSEPMNMIVTALSVAMAIGLFIMSFNMSKRTPYGAKVLGKIKGFRRFLETAEKDRLEMLVDENPTYFFDILPYAYVLGVSDRWISQFEDLVTGRPEWLISDDVFRYSEIVYLVDNELPRMGRDSYHRPVTHYVSSGGSGSYSSSDYSSGYSSSDYSSSSSSSGGGSSGGGSGGGGGSSW